MTKLSELEKQISPLPFELVTCDHAPGGFYAIRSAGVGCQKGFYVAEMVEGLSPEMTWANMNYLVRCANAMPLVLGLLGQFAEHLEIGNCNNKCANLMAQKSKKMLRSVEDGL